MNTFWEGSEKGLTLITDHITDYIIPENLSFFLLYVSEVPANICSKFILHHFHNAAKPCIPLNWKDLLPSFFISMGLKR